MVASYTLMTTRTITYADLDVHMEDVYEQMGYADSKPDADVQAEIDSVIADISQWLRPQIAFTVFHGTLDTETETLDIQDKHLECGRIITRQLRGSEAYTLFICTAGQEFQQLMDRLTEEGDMVRLFTANAIGSVLAERTADYMERMLQAQIDKLGWKRTNRFSPGYCGWHVREQQKLFPLMGGETATVHLTDSSLMLPIKSVSGIIGIGPDVHYLPYTCGLCDKKDCYKKRKRK